MPSTHQAFLQQASLESNVWQPLRVSLLTIRKMKCLVTARRVANKHAKEETHGCNRCFDNQCICEETLGGC